MLAPRFHSIFAVACALALASSGTACTNAADGDAHVPGARSASHTQDLTGLMSSSPGSTLIGATGPRVIANSIPAGAPTVTALEIGAPTIWLARGTSRGLVATGTLTDGTKTDVTAFVTWASSDESIATVSNASGSRGVVEAQRVGRASVVASLGGVRSDAVSVRVVYALPTSLWITPHQSSAVAGERVQFVLVARYADGSDEDATGRTTWSSSSPSVATFLPYVVEEVPAGLLATASPGVTTISAEYEGLTVSTTLTVLWP